MTDMTMIAPDGRAADASKSLCFFVPVKRRMLLPYDVWDAYWKDIHSQIVTRLPGIRDYTQSHAHRPRADLWPRISGVEHKAAETQMWDGTAELSFRDEDDLARWIASSGVLAADEANAFERTVGYFTAPGTARDFVSQARSGLGGPTRNFVLRLLLTGKSPEDRETLHARIMDDVCPIWASSPLVERLRVLPLLEHDNHAETGGAAKGGNNVEPVEIQHHASVEIGFDSHLAFRQFLASPAYLSTERILQDSLFRLTAMQEYSAYQCVKDGRPTLVGMYGATNAAIIESVGAASMLSHEVRRLFGH